MEMNIHGNIVPLAWYRTILTEKGKSHMLAIAILSDIVSGFKIKVKRDVVTGVVGLEKMNTEDMLRRSYSIYEELFGETRKSIQRAMVVLEKKGLIKREFRIVRESDGRIKTNEMFLTLNVEELYEVTYPMEFSERKKKEKRMENKEKRDGQGCSTGKKSMEGFNGQMCPHGVINVADIDLDKIENELQILIEACYDEGII